MGAALREQEVICRGLRMLVRESGPARAPVVLLAHGMWCEGGMFADLSAELSRTCRVVIPDFRAHGGSELPERPWTMRDLALDLVALFDELEIPKAAVVGFSMGGMAALHLALEEPGRVSALGLISTSAEAEDLIRVAEMRALDKLIDLVGAPHWMVHQASRATFEDRFRRDYPQAVTRWESAIMAMPRPALRQALEAVADRPSVAPRLGEIRAPVFIMTGREDRIVAPHCSRTLAAGIPHGLLIELRQTGHAVPMEQPGKTAEAIRQVL
jgi:pimeloyl-ACP methyl ester carboxylesterase